MNSIMVIIFVVSDSWGFLRKIYFPKNSMIGGPLQGTTKWDRQILKKYFIHFEYY